MVDASLGHVLEAHTPSGRRFKLAPEFRMFRVCRTVVTATGEITDEWVEQLVGTRFENGNLTEVWERCEAIPAPDDSHHES